MMRILLIVVHAVLIAATSYLYVQLGGGGLITWFITVVTGVLTLFAIVIALTLIIAQVPLRPVTTTLGAYAGEYFASVKLFCVDLLRPTPTLQAPNEAPTSSDHLPILFIHGFMCNNGFWHQYLKRYQSRWHNYIGTISMEPLHGPIDVYAAQIEERIDELLAQSKSSKCLIVAHSMGGLATRSYLRQFGHLNKVKGVITLGTPHSGTMLASFSLGKNAKQMRRLSKWRDRLFASEDAIDMPPFEALIGTHDNIVAPQECARYERANNTYMNGVTHLAMAYDHAVIEWTFERLVKLNKSS